MGVDDDMRLLISVTSVKCTIPRNLPSNAQRVCRSFRFLIHLLLSDRGWDRDFAEAYLTEALSRQVSWYVKQRLDGRSSRVEADVSDDVSVDSCSTDTSALSEMQLQSQYELELTKNDANAVPVPEPKFPELMYLERDEVSPYRLVTTFQVE